MEIPEIEARYCHSFLLSWRTAASLIIPVPSISLELAFPWSIGESALEERHVPPPDRDDLLKNQRFDDWAAVRPYRIVIGDELLPLPLSLSLDSLFFPLCREKIRILRRGKRAPFIDVGVDATDTLGKPHISDRAETIEWNRMIPVTARGQHISHPPLSVHPLLSLVSLIIAYNQRKKKSRRNHDDVSMFTRNRSVRTGYVRRFGRTEISVGKRTKGLVISTNWNRFLIRWFFLRFSLNFASTFYTLNFQRNVVRGAVPLYVKYCEPLFRNVDRWRATSI